ncbi:MAG TPA: 16S rRNA (cytosine(1402)-N(4))-methyltransferase RsmH [Desulfosalsimonadaceae bacterium]|nr:16S rRNA (cytosine(1402)-N(4))-methyltransferase RsmH [Desulfosalsimonadaceae bacterium]
MKYRHIPVMVEETLGFLNCRPGQICVDCTVGGAGHAKAIIEKILPDGLLIGIDQDADAIEAASRGLSDHQNNVHLFHDNFVNLPEILTRLHISAVDGILADLGLSLYQLESSNRGFSFQGEEPLDMRMNTDDSSTAEDIINSASPETLKYIFKAYGEEKWAGAIARKIVDRRKRQRIRTNRELVELVCAAIPGSVAGKRKIHPATKVFMALRIAVNRELERLEQFLSVAVDALKPGGRLCILSFHSLEDRIVKHRLKSLENPCTCPRDFPQCVCGKKPVVRVLTRKVRRPGQAEIEKNPKARSTCLRAAEKL